MILKLVLLCLCLWRLDGNLIPVKVHWNGSQTRDFPPVNSY